MGLLARIKRFLTSPEDDSKPSCPGCGRPVSEPGSVCADCSSDQTQRPGG